MPLSNKNTDEIQIELLQEINKKLEKIIALLGMQGKDIDTQIAILKNLDFTWEEIGTFVGMGADAVRMRNKRKKV